MILQTETAEAQFLRRGVRHCVIIPTLVGITILDVLDASGGFATIHDEDEDEAGDDLLVLRIGDRSQQAIELSLIKEMLREANPHHHEHYRV
jgi:hypothetical protein